MKVLVTVKEVAEADDDFAIEGTDIAESDLEYDLNEWDDYAVEAAVQLAESGIADEVVAVTVGPERAEETIRMALAKGADRAVRVWDDALEGSFPDVASKVDLFEAVVAEEKPDLILGGVQAADTGFGATGVALAERIGFEHAAVVNHLGRRRGRGRRARPPRAGGGVEELTDVDLPAVLTVQTGLNEPR
ncbi:electron transfer flavoprotein subunit beta/FixA family protein [Halorubrum sp. AJ67]|uniref:electron transfer flavoprotein subunit beta/FixA family protein n=1 Tax=Halorubrum sp. AJ67 TaxID=1173487 RepID=UPI0003DDA6D8|nr:electron transfer flavoprotein subunit beta/FixA family protein [Halorubrum sp. AJ67]CDK39242.1 electron transfer flavoprotein alpha/beta-subunit [Halorubrum sp. AJ67]